MKDERMDITRLSDIDYSICNIGIQTIAEGLSSEYRFEPLSGKIIASIMFRLRTVGRGKNLMTLTGNDGLPALSIWCEGVGILSWDGNERKMIARYRDDEWCSLRVSLDTESGTYDVCADGKRVLSGARLMNNVKSVDRFEAASRMGDLRLRQVFLYRNPVQSVREAAGEGTVYDVTDFGALGDGRTVSTRGIQKAIDACSSGGGGVVYLQGGTFLSGMIELKKGTGLYIETDAVLKGVTDPLEYPTMTPTSARNWNMLRQGPQKALVYADGVEGIVIQGGGMIDGSGNFPGDYGSESSRPCAVLLAGCANAKIQHISIEDAGMWTVPLVECDGLYMRDVNIYSCWFPNRDGIDLCDCHDVLVENTSITADDDAVCFKSGHERGCDNILIRQMMIASPMANAVKFGTYSFGGFSNCSVRDCVIKDTRHAAMAVEIVDGGTAENLRFERVEVSGTGSAFFIVLGDRGNIPPWGTHRIGSIQGLVFEDIAVEGLSRNYGSYVSGLAKDGTTYPVRDVIFRNVHARFRGGVAAVPPAPPEYPGTLYPECDMFGVLPASAYFLRHTEAVVFEGCETNVAEHDARSPVVKV